MTAPFAVSPVLGTPPVRNVPSGGNFFISFAGETGTLSSTGFLRTPAVGATTVWWGGYTGASNSAIVSQDANYAIFGDSGGAALASILRGFSMELQSRSIVNVYANAGLGSISIREFNTIAHNINFDIAVAAGTTRFRFGPTIVPIIRQDQDTANAAGGAFLIQAQQGGSGGANNNGGPLNLVGGAQRGAGLKGPARLAVGVAADTLGETMVEVVEIAAGRRVVALARGTALAAVDMPANTGDLVVNIGAAATAPTAAPGSGTIVYSVGGAAPGLGIFTSDAAAVPFIIRGTTAAAATAGAGALPAAPEEFAVILVNGNIRKIPLYLN